MNTGKQTTPINCLNTPRSPTDLAALLDEIRTSSFIGRVALHTVNRHIAGNTILFFYDGTQLVGLGAWTLVGKQWIELGPVYVARARRGEGIGYLMFAEMADRVMNRGRHLYAVTKNPRIMHILDRRDFTPVSVFKLPLVLQLHLLRKLNLLSLIQLIRKYRPNERVAHYVLHSPQAQ